MPVRKGSQWRRHAREVTPGKRLAVLPLWHEGKRAHTCAPCPAAAQLRCLWCGRLSNARQSWSMGETLARCWGQFRVNLGKVLTSAIRGQPPFPPRERPPAPVPAPRVLVASSAPAGRLKEAVARDFVVLLHSAVDADGGRVTSRHSTSWQLPKYGVFPSQTEKTKHETQTASVPYVHRREQFVQCISIRHALRPLLRGGLSKSPLRPQSTLQFCRRRPQDPARQPPSSPPGSSGANTSAPAHRTLR